MHWRLIDYVFPAGRQPWWAVSSPTGQYWAPDIYRIDHRWVVYFAAQLDSSRLDLHYPGGSVQPGSFVIGVATSKSLHGPWWTKVLHYRGEFNRASRDHERYGAVIDPSMVRDPRTGQQYLFWAEQHSSIWASKLSSDGTRLDPHIHEVMWAKPGWDCVVSCVVEGPEELYHQGWFYLFYSGASTWNGSYAVGVAVSRNPLESIFLRLDPGPALHSGQGWDGPGGSSRPILGPDGKWYIFYHATLGPDYRHILGARLLLRSQIVWTGIGGYYPKIGDGMPG